MKLATLQQQQASASPSAPSATDDPLLDTDYEGFCRREAARRGIDPEIAVRGARTEGGVSEPARHGDFSGAPWYSGKSWWMFQEHYGGQGPRPLPLDDYRAWGGSAGLGNSFTAMTGWEPGDPRAWRDAARYALDDIKAHGWGAYYGPAAIGITGFRGVARAIPWNGTPDDEWDYRKLRR